MKTSSTWLEAIPQGGPLFRRQAKKGIRNNPREMTSVVSLGVRFQVIFSTGICILILHAACA
jgi:hypothetical protein